MGKVENILISLALAILVSGCIEKFDYTPDEPNPGYLVIDGGITNSQTKQFIRLSRTTAYGISQYVPESGAIITILEDGNAVEYCRETSEGNYMINGDIINPSPGKKYSIEIKTTDGNTYQSVPEIMPYPVIPDTAYFEMEKIGIRNDAGVYIYKWTINVYVDSPVRTENSYAFMRWRVEEMYSFTELNDGPLFIPHTCYMNLDINDQNIQIYSGEDLTGGILRRKLVLTRFPDPDQEFIFVHYFSIMQHSITRSCYEYWNKLQAVANPSGSFIDPPPAAVIGNIHNVNDKNDIALGYFEVAAEEIIRVKCFPSRMLPYYVHNPCSEYPLPNYCYGCLNLPNSSRERPSFW